MNLQTLTLSTLKPAPYNPRKISDDAMGRLEKSVKEWGIVDPLIVNKATGYTIIGGHQRFKVLQKQGAQTADCVVLDLPPAKEKALNIALNNQKMAGEYEFSTLADILQEIDTGEFSVPDLTGFSEEDLESIATWATSPDHTPDDPNTEWEGMPEFKNEEVEKAYKSLIVHFQTEESFDEFAKKTDQTITSETKFIWLPYKPKKNLKAFSCE
jgi:hypothetical protein